MVFGNNLIDFAANGINAGTTTWPSPTSPLLSTIGQYPSIPPSNSPPKKILPLEITKTYTGLTFTVKLNGNNYNGCGPQHIVEDLVEDYDFGGACVSYPSSLSKGEIERKLLKFLKNLRKQEEEQKKYKEAQAKWEQDRAGCNSEQKEGSTFRFVNADRNYAPVGPPTENWICQESIMATESESEPEEDTTETEEESSSDGVVTTQSVRSSQTPTKSLSIGFGQGVSRILQRGVLIGGILIVGYGAYKIEDKTHIIANLVGGKKIKKNTDKEIKPTIKE